MYVCVHVHMRGRVRSHTERYHTHYRVINGSLVKLFIASSESNYRPVHRDDVCNRDDAVYRGVPVSAVVLFMSAGEWSAVRQ